MYIGNERTMLVHTPECDAVFKMNPLNHAVFSELYDALGCGYAECQYCLGESKGKYTRLNEIKRAVRNESFGVCLCCGETRGVQRAHIIPRANGGIDVMPLCPCCHWNYDNGLLNDEELEIIHKWIDSHKPHLMAQYA